MDTAKRVAVIMNIDRPLKRYHKQFAGMKEYASQHTDWNLVWDPHPELKLEESPDSPCYAGLIGRCRTDTYKVASKMNVPIINTWFNNKIQGLTSIFPDYRQSGQIAAENMIKRGFRNFVIIGYNADKSTKVFTEGVKSVVGSYKCSLKTYGFLRDVEKDKESWKKMNTNFQKWIKDWNFPIAILTAASDLGPKISTFCTSNELKVPDQVAIASSGNDLNFCESIAPYISSVDIDDFQIGFEAAKLLDHKIKGKEIDKQVHLVAPRGFVARESTDFFAVRDEYVQLAMRYIADNYEKNIYIEDVVNQLPISRRSLEIKFEKEIGHTMHEEISRLRIETCKKLLFETNLKIKDISLSAGFSCSQHMRRAFQKITGVKPSDFRKSRELS